MAFRLTRRFHTSPVITSYHFQFYSFTVRNKFHFPYPHFNGFVSINFWILSNFPILHYNPMKLNQYKKGILPYLHVWISTKYDKQSTYFASTFAVVRKSSLFSVAFILVIVYIFWLPIDNSSQHCPMAMNTCATHYTILCLYRHFCSTNTRIAPRIWIVEVYKCWASSNWLQPVELIQCECQWQSVSAFNAAWNYENKYSEWIAFITR